MMSDTAVRTLRQVAEVLREIHVWDESIEHELAITSRRLDVLADAFEEKVIEFPRNDLGKPTLHLVQRNE